MNKWIPAAVGAAVVVALGAGAWYCGLRAEQAFKEELSKVNTGPAIKLELGDYDRGLFRSHGVLKVQFVAPGEEESPVLFEQPFTVVHGPILWDSTFAFRPAAFGFKAHLEAQPEWPADAKTVLADERVRLISHVGFGGGSHTEFRIGEGELQLPSGKLDLQRGVLAVDYDPSDKQMKADFNWPGFVFGSEMGEFKMADMAFQWAGTYYSQNVQIGSGEYRIGSISAKQGEMEAFAMNALTMTGKQDLDSSGEKLSSAVDMKLANVMFMGQEMVKDGKLHLEINNLSLAALKKLDETTGAQMNPEQMDEVFANLSALLQHGVELKIEPLQAQIQGQPFELKLLAKLPPAEGEVDNPMLLMQSAEADLNVSTSSTLLAMWAPAEIAALADESGKIAVQLRQGQLTVNGQPYTPGAGDAAADAEYTEEADWADQEVLEAEQAAYEDQEI